MDLKQYCVDAIEKHSVMVAKRWDYNILLIVNVFCLHPDVFYSIIKIQSSES